MKLVTTSLGFKFETDEDVGVGQRIDVPPPPEPEEYTLASDKVLNFMAQMYGLQKEWSQEAMGRFAAPEGLHHFPSYILTLREDRLKKFMIRLYSAGGSMIKHYSSSGKDQAEVRFNCKHESLAHELQFLWWRLGVKTRVVNHPQKGWLVQTSGSGAYVRIREYIKKTANPRLTKKLKGLDAMVPIQFKLADQAMQDKVVSVEDLDVQS